VYAHVWTLMCVCMPSLPPTFKRVVWGWPVLHFGGGGRCQHHHSKTLHGGWWNTAVMSRHMIVLPLPPTNVCLWGAVEGEVKLYHLKCTAVVCHIYGERSLSEKWLLWVNGWGSIPTRNIVTRANLTYLKWLLILQTQLYSLVSLKFSIFIKILLMQWVIQ
jgi:hypothetical protein